MHLPRSLKYAAAAWAAALLGALPLLASAAQAPIVDLMTGRAPNPAALVPARGFAGSSLEGRFNTAALGAGRLRVDVGDGRQLVAGLTRESRGARGDRSWTGEFEGAPRARPAGDTATTGTATGGVVALATAAEPVVQDMMVVYTAAAAASSLAISRRASSTPWQRPTRLTRPAA
ncbi:MAG: hypothetical protein RLZZ200_1635 [Pseudomonadota bacterium]|jgi:hypothetical protein